MVTIRDRTFEVSLSVASLGDRCADSRERLQERIEAVQREAANAREAADSCAARLQGLEARIGQIDDAIRGLAQRQQQVADVVADQVTRLAAARLQAGEQDRQIMGEMENLNRQTQAAFAHLGQQVQAVSAACSDSVARLAGATRAALEVVRAEHDSNFERVAQQIEKSTAETDQCFGKLESDFVQVVGAISGLCASVEAALCSESGQRCSGEQKVFDGFESFTNAVAGQLANHMKAVELVQTNVHGHVESICGSFFLAWKGDLANFLRDVTASVAENQARTATVEQRLSEYIVSVGRRQDEIRALIDSKLVIQAPDSDLGARVAKLEERVAAKAPPQPPRQVTQPQQVQVHPIWPGTQFIDPARGKIASPSAGPSTEWGDPPDPEPPATPDPPPEPDPEPDPPGVVEIPPDAPPPTEPPQKRPARAKRKKTTAGAAGPGDGGSATNWDLFGDVEPSLRACEFPDELIVPPGADPPENANPRGRR
jgi:hypothetical protein